MAPVGLSNVLRQRESRHVVVVVNRGDGSRAARGLPAGRYADLQTNETISAEQVEVGARQIRLLKRVEE